MKRNEQENFWEQKYSKEYIEKNSDFDNKLGASAWTEMLSKISGDINNYLECGCNIGKNINQISIAHPELKPNIIEISEEAFDIVTKNNDFDHAFNGSILDSDFGDNKFDLVFTKTVLIHINPDELLKTITKMFDYSSKYILVGEYFNRTPVMIEYQGEVNKLFKRDFGKLIMENFDCDLIDNGFFWGHLYDNAGFDDITWWVFKKK